MLNREEIVRIAKFTGLRLHQQEKNYIQTLILKSIYSKFNPVFKGGTALMMAYNLNRFSEDLDFTAEKPLDLEKVKLSISQDLSLMNVNAKFDKIKDTDLGISFRIGTQGPLFQKEFDRCYVYVEISNREKILLKPEIHSNKPLYPDLTPFQFPVMHRDEILSEKIRAILTRNKARDLFDAWFLVNQGASTSVEMINKKLSFYKIKYSHEAFIKRLSTYRFKWKSELQAFIFGQFPPIEDILKELPKRLQV